MKNIAMLTRMAARQMSGRDLAARAGVSPQTVSGMLNCRRVPRRGTLDRVAAALGCEVTELANAGNQRRRLEL